MKTNIMRQRILGILVVVLGSFTFLTTTVYADFFSLYGRGMPWQDNGSWGLGGNSMLNLCTDWNCSGIGGFSSHFQRNGNYLPNVPIVAISDGVIQALSSDSYNGCGNYVSVDHQNGYVSKVCHITTWGTHPVRGTLWGPGDQVKKGNILGYIYSDNSNIKDIYFTLWSQSQSAMINPTDVGSFEGCFANSQSSTYWEHCPVSNFYDINPYQPVKSDQTATRGNAPYEPDQSQQIAIYPYLKNYGYFLPEGYNADTLSQANQNISFLPHDEAADPVNTATGFLDHTNVDLDYPVVGGVPFEFRRSYVSDSTYKGVLSVGWRTSFDMKIVANNIYNNAYWTVLFPDGHGETFQDADNDFRTFDTTFTAVNAESKGTLTRYDATGGDGAYGWNFVYTDNQTGQKFIFEGLSSMLNQYGKLRNITYPTGDFDRFTYDSAGNLTDVSDEWFHRSFHFNYDASARLTKVTDGSGRFVDYTYNYDGRLSTVKNPLGGITTYTYDSANRINSIKDPLNHIIESTVYDSQGRVTSLTDANLNARTYAYTSDATSYTTTITDQLGNITIHKHNLNYYLTELTKPNGDIYKYEYDSKGNRTKETLPDGKVYQYSYDAKGNRTVVTYPNSYLVTTTYNNGGKPTQIVEGNNDRVKTFAYDSSYNLTKETDALGSSTNYEYSNGLLTKVTDANYNSKVYAYDSNGFLVQEKAISNDAALIPNVSPTAATDTYMTYHFEDSSGISDSSPNGNNGANITNATTIPGKIIRGKDFAGNGTFSTSLNGLPATTNTLSIDFWAYTRNQGNNTFLVAAGDDANNRLNIHLPWGGNGTIYWDFGNVNTTGRLTTAFDNSWYNQWTHWVFTVDSSGMKIFRNGVQIASKSGASTFTKGTKTLYVASSGGVQNWNGMIDEFKIVNRSLTSTEVLNDYNNYSNFFANRPTLNYTNDSRGNRLTMTDALNHVSAFTYDNLNNILTAKDPKNNTKSKTYNTAGKLTSETDEAAIVKTYTYDNNYNITQAQFGANQINQNVYDKNNNKTKETDPNGNYKVTTYDLNNRPTKFQYYNAANTLLTTQEVTYNLAGLKATEKDGNGNITSYLYDNLNHLTKITKGTVFKNTTYDFWGNLLSETDWQGNQYDYTYDKLNRLLTKKNPLERTGTGLGITYAYDNVGNVTQITDSLGQITKQFWDTNKKLIKVINPKNLTATYTYDLAGNLTQQSNFAGELTTLTYDANSNLLTSKDNLNKTTTYEYDARNLQTKVIDANNNATTIGYDQYKQKTSETNQLTFVKSYSYDAAGNLLTSTDEENNVTTLTYDGLNRKKTVTVKRAINGTVGDSITSFTYDGNNNVLNQVDANNNTTINYYDSFNRITQITNPNATTKKFTYSANGNVLTSTDENNAVTTFTYDVLNRKTSIKDPENYTRTYVYDVAGQLTSESDAKAQNTLYEYDAAGNLKKITDRANSATNITYDNGNRILTLTQPNGLVITYAYDAVGRQVSQTKSGTGITTIAESYTYDNVGNLLTYTNTNGGTSSYLYDQANRVTKVTNPLTTFTTIAYNKKGDIVSKTDENGNTTTYTYDPSSDLTMATDPLSFQTKYSYDANGNQIQVTDGRNNTTTYTFDTLNRKTKTTAPGSIITSQTQYDNAGNIWKQTDGNGKVTTYSYYLNNRVKNITDALNGVVAYEYDGNGNLTKKTNQLNGISTFVYNTMDKLTQKTDEGGNVWNYTYDTAGNLLTTTDPKTIVETNTYNILGRKTKTAKDGGVTLGAVETNYQYDNAGNLLKTIDPNGHAITNQYDALNRLTKVLNDNNDYKQFTYDNIGNITQIRDENGNVSTYTYDNDYRRTQAKDPLNNITAFTFDANGNQLTKTNARNNTETRNYDALNRMTSLVDEFGSTAYYTYDNAGNMLTEKKFSGTIYTFTYDALNRKTKTVSGGVTLSQTEYDALGRTTKDIDAMTYPTNYQYDALGHLTKVTDALTHQTTYQYDAVGNMTKQIDANLNVTNFAYDNLNNLVTETDALNKVWSYEYDKAGNLTKETDANGNINLRTYDINNRITAKNYMNGSTVLPESVNFEYDKVGNLTKIYNAASTNNYTYDANYNILTATDSRNYNLSYTYDANNNKASMTYGDGNVTSYSYNNGDGLMYLKIRYTGDSIASTSGNAAFLQTVFTYDKNGNLIRQNNPDSTVSVKTYNSLDQLKEINNYKYTTAWNVVDYTISDYKYTLNANGDKTATTFTTNCDKNAVCNAATTYTSTDTYAYDAARRLTSDIHTVNNPANLIESSYTNTYTYDAAGNRTSMATNEGMAQTTINYTFNGNNQLTAENNWAYTYDNNGNRITKTNASTSESENMTYDRANQITNVTSSLKDSAGMMKTYNISYTYDGLGRRTARINNTAAPLGTNTSNVQYDGVSSQQYVYDQQNYDMVTEYTKRVNAVTNIVGLPGTQIYNVHTNYYLGNIDFKTPSTIASMDVSERTPSNNTTTDWAWVSDTASSDPAHNWIVTPDTVQKLSYFQRDGNDSIVSKTSALIRYKASDSTGTMIFTKPATIKGFNLLNQTRYDDYGKKMNASQTSPLGTGVGDWTTRQYSGQVYDIETGNYYYGSRFYDASNGTWNKQDSYRGDMRTPLSRNRYSFVNENPVNRNDVYGFATVEELNKAKDTYTKVLDPIQKQLDNQKSLLSDATKEAERLYWVRNDTVKNAYNAKTAYDNANNLKSIANYLGLQGWIMQQINNNVSNTKANYDNANQAFWTANSQYSKALTNVTNFQTAVNILSPIVDGLKNQINAINSEINTINQAKTNQTLNFYDSSQGGNAIMCQRKCDINTTSNAVNYTSYRNEVNAMASAGKNPLNGVSGVGVSTAGGIGQTTMVTMYSTQVHGDMMLGDVLCPICNLKSWFDGSRYEYFMKEERAAKEMGVTGAYDELSKSWDSSINKRLKSLGINPNRRSSDTGFTQIACTLGQGGCNWLDNLSGKYTPNGAEVVYDTINLALEIDIAKNVFESAAGGAKAAGKFFSEDGVKIGENSTLQLRINNPINISTDRLNHVIEGHIDLTTNLDKSKFSENINIFDLIRKGESIKPSSQSNGNLYRIIKSQNIIGVDAMLSTNTNVYTIITDSKNNLVTAFPGMPRSFYK